MHTYIINLPERTERLSSAQAQLAKAGIKEYSVYPAFDTRHGVVKSFISASFTRGALGCMMSHLAIMKYAVMNKIDGLLIVEDDIIYTGKAKVSEAIKNAPDADVLFLGYMPREGNEFYGIDGWGRTTKSWGSHAVYFPTYAGIERIVSKIESSEWSRQYDGILYTLVRNGIVTGYWPEESLFAQDLEFGSDIQNAEYHNRLKK